MIVVKMLKASHFGPTILVTSISLLLAHNFFSWSESCLIALAVFSGQLAVGWHNDIEDVERDRLQNRSSKPLFDGTLTVHTLRRALYVDLVVCVFLSYVGPLGFRGGTLHLFGVGCGLSYNGYFKFRKSSPLPYIFAFASLASIAHVAAHRSLPLWLMCAGGLFGLSAHFANVLKDLEADRLIGINGLPQIVGIQVSVYIAGTSLAAVAGFLTLHTSRFHFLILTVTFLALATLLLRPKKYGFQAIMLLSLVDVATLLFSNALR